MKLKLSILWVFATLNYLYCDVVSLMDREMLQQYLTGKVGGVQVTQAFLLASGVLVEIFIAMVLLSRVLSYRTNRWANVTAGTVLTVVQVATLLFGSLTYYYLFFSAIEIASTALVVWLAWNWREPAVQTERTDRELSASRR